MALSVFQEMFSEKIKTDLRNANDFLAYMLATAASREVEAEIRSGKGRFADTINWEHITTANTGDLESLTTTVASQATVDLSSSYPLLVGTQIQGSFDKLAIATAKIPYAYADFHPAGGNLPSFVEEGLKQQIKDQIEANIISVMYADGAGKTGAAGFDMDTSSAANLTGDYQALSEFADSRNWSEDRIVVARASELKHAALPYSTFTSHDFNMALNPVAGGGLAMFNGWKHIYSNNVTSTQGVAFIPSSYALVMMDPVTQILEDKDERSFFMRVWVNFGTIALRGVTTNADASSTGNPREGVAYLAVA